MQYLSLIFTLLTLFVNYWGLVLATGLIWRNRWVAAIAGPWICTTFFFAIECHWGLGGLSGLGMASTVASLALIFFSFCRWIPSWIYYRHADFVENWRREFEPRNLVGCGGAFLAMFFYAFSWRYIAPNIDGSSEKLADLAYIASYYSGKTIPVPDVWLFPYVSTQYYSFQYYAAGLAGRMFSWPIGVTYNLSYSFLVGLTGLSFAGAVCLLTRRRWAQILLVAAFFLSGSGVSGFVHLVFKSSQLWQTVRFIGIAVPYDGGPGTVGPALMKYKEKFKRMELPGESFAYTAALGDYHPPFSGYYLLGTGVVAAILWQRTGRRRFAVLVGATLTWSLLANTWTFPFQLIWIAGWSLWNIRSWQRLWTMVAAGAAVVWLASVVYLSAFAAASTEYRTAIRLVPWSDHTPPLLFLMFLLPTIGLVVISFYTARKEIIWLGIAGVFYLFLSEFIYIDDVYVIEFERFNTTLKWWPWIAAAALMVVAPLILERCHRRWVKVVALFFCFYPCVFGFDLANQWWRIDKSTRGLLEGTEFLTRNERSKFVLARLKLVPKGVVIERPNKDSFTNSACLPVFAGQQMWLGWVGHEMLWHGYSGDIIQRQDRLMEFYKGEMADPANWISAERIDYILWYQEADTNELWTKLDAQLRASCVWVELFKGMDGRKTGMWRRRDKTPLSP